MLSTNLDQMVAVKPAPNGPNYPCDESEMTLKYPLTTTLNRIWAHGPCERGWEYGLRSVGKDSPDDEPISYQQIVDKVGLINALWCCRAEPQYASEWRLYAVWCARQVQHLMKDQRSIDALDVSERYANGDATDEELCSARAAASSAAENFQRRFQVDSAARSAALASTWAAATAASWAAALVSTWAAATAAARAAQRDAFIQLVTTGTLPAITKLP